jgi:hypothetical protein
MAPCSAANPDESAYLFFEGGPKGWHEDGFMASFNLSWLLEGEPTGDGTLSDWIATPK